MFKKGSNRRTSEIDFAASYVDPTETFALLSEN